MNQEKLLEDIAALPPVAQQEAIDFVTFLRSRYGESPAQPSDSLSTLEDEPFIGMWKNHSEMTDSHAWVRHLREKEWN